MSINVDEENLGFERTSPLAISLDSYDDTDLNGLTQDDIKLIKDLNNSNVIINNDNSSIFFTLQQQQQQQLLLQEEIKESRKRQKKEKNKIHASNSRKKRKQRENDQINEIKNITLENIYLKKSMKTIINSFPFIYQNFPECFHEQYGNIKVKNNQITNSSNGVNNHFKFLFEVSSNNNNKNSNINVIDKYYLLNNIDNYKSISLLIPTTPSVQVFDNHTILTNSITFDSSDSENDSI